MPSLSQPLLDQTSGFGIYVHWPFCAAKCPYCDFNSHVRHQKIDQKRFIKAFEQELEHNRELSGARTVTSIFLGGGTPSLMDPDTVDAILSQIRNLWDVPNDIEITMEANPSSVEASRFRGYHDAGVNRVSMGVQALNDRDLKFLGRLHSVEDAKKAINLAREIFPRMSFDLIYGRPNQTIKSWQNELIEAIDMAVDHLSLYQLTIEEGTPFFKLHEAGKIVTLDDDHLVDIYKATQELCASYNLPAYEVSNHAKVGAESRHNLNYWRYGDYVGVGPGAHGRISVNETKLATITEPHPENWASSVKKNGHGIITEEILEKNTQADEVLIMGLRLKEGIDVARWENLSGRSFNTAREANLLEQDLIERLGNSRIRCTDSGILVLNSIIAELA